MSGRAAFRECRNAGNRPASRGMAAPAGRARPARGDGGRAGSTKSVRRLTRGQSQLVLSISGHGAGKAAFCFVCVCIVDINTEPETYVK